MVPMAVLRLACRLVVAVSAVLGNAWTIRGIQAGVNAYTGERPLRQDFSTFKNSGPAFDLYIQALSRIQQADQKHILSYFEVAGECYCFVQVRSVLMMCQGIHGVPFRAWDGVTGKKCGCLLSSRQRLIPYLAQTVSGVVRGEIISCQH